MIGDGMTRGLKVTIVGYMTLSAVLAGMDTNVILAGCSLFC